VQLDSIGDGTQVTEDSPATSSEVEDARSLGQAHFRERKDLL
jgi:hypothetical protein